MKKVLMFIMETCPHCKKAREDMQQLFDKHPEYKQVDLTIIDETQQPDLADKYDYYYVPTFYVDGRKVHEGATAPNSVADVFKEAMQD